MISLSCRLTVMEVQVGHKAAPEANIYQHGSVTCQWHFILPANGITSQPLYANFTI
jgi:hypothetical protein